MTNDGSYIHADTVIEERRDVRAFLYLASFARQHLLRFALGFLCLVTAAILVMISARALGFIVDALLASRSPELFWIVLLVSCESGALLFTWGGRLFVSQASLRSVLEVRKRLFEHMQLLPLSYFDRTPIGRTMTRLTFDVESLEDFFGSSMGKLLNCFIVAGAALVAMFFTNAFLSLWVAAAVLPSVALTLLTRNRAKLVNREISKRNSATNAMLSEFLNGLHVIRMVGVEAWSKARYDALVGAHAAAQTSLIVMYSWLRPLIGLLSMLPMLVLLWSGVGRVLDGLLTVGALVSFTRYFERFGRPMMELSFEIHVVQQAFTSAERVATFLKEKEEHHELGADGTLRVPKFRGDLSFDNVFMSYGKGLPALKGVTFACRAGDVVGLTGATGSGKSSTVALLARLYEYSHGQILLDGKDLRSYARSALRAQIGFVSQEVMIVKGTVRENLLFHSPVGDEQLQEACHQSGLASVLSRNGLTLDSLLLEQGANLSVGERQLLSITRIFVRDPSILILDEATAHIDPALEQVIHEAMYRLSKGRTTLLIAHRLHTLLRCDSILVFREGQVVEQGAHAALIEHGGYYRDLWNNFELNSAVS